MRTPSRQNSIALWLIAAACAALWISLGWTVQEHARTNDFLCTYSTAYITSHGRMAHIYDPAVQAAVQKSLTSPENRPRYIQWPPLPFNRPPFYALLLAPLAWLPLGASFVCWILLQVGVFLACLAWGWRRFGTLAVAFGCMSMPAALGIAHGQDCAMFLGVLIASYALAEKGMEFASGAVLGLLLVKFNLTPLWFIALLMQRRWRALAGFAATGTAVAGISLAMVGLDGVRAYAAMLLNRDFAWLAAGPDFMISFQGLAYNLGIASPWAQAAMVAAIFAVFLAAVWQAPLWRIYTATTAASLLVAPHVLGYDAAMLLLGLWLVIFRDSLRPTRIVALWLFMPFPFSFTLVGKPWVAISSLSLLALVMALAGEGVSARRAARLNVPGPPNP